MPNFPFPEKGAEEADRAGGLFLLKSLGHELCVIAKYPPSEKHIDLLYKHAENLQIELLLLPHWKKPLWKRLNPLWLDGAAYEFHDPAFLDAIENKIQNWGPKILWVDNTFLWPVARLAKQNNIPVILRSLNIEPLHLLQESGKSLLNFIRATSKLLGEIIAVRTADIVYAITPNEARILRRFTSNPVCVLPLRALPSLLGKSNAPTNHSPLRVVFMGSTYNVQHNLRAAKMVIEQIAPLAEREAPGEFVFSITGGKLPTTLNKACGKNIHYEGYVDDLNIFLSNIDIAIAPSLFGAGMQQKVFEPIARGIPTITSSRALAGYPFIDKKEVLLANTPEEFVDALLSLRSVSIRKALTDQAIKMASTNFSEEQIINTINKGLHHVL